MINVSVSELEGAQLDWAVAVALGLTAVIENGMCQVLTYKDGTSETYQSRTWLAWDQAGPIIERDRIWLSDDSEGNWQAAVNGPVAPSAHNYWIGSAPLIAAMRAFVASKLGDTVEVPHGQA